MVDEAQSVYMPTLILNEMKIKQDQRELNRPNVPTKSTFYPLLAYRIIHFISYLDIVYVMYLAVSEIERKRKKNLNGVDIMQC